VLDPARLREFVPFNTLPEAALGRLAAELALERLPKGTVLCEEGAADHEAIYLVEGALELLTRGSTLARVLQAGTPEAAHPVAPGTPRPCTVRALSPAAVFRIDRRKLDRLIVFESLTTLVTTIEPGGPGRVSLDAPLATALAAHPVFRDLPRRQMQKLVVALRPRRVKSSEVVVRQGQPCECYYIVREGRFAVSRKDERGKVHLLGELTVGTSFGADPLASAQPSATTVVALGPGLLLCLPKDAFEDLLEGKG
jgi:CRP-like cAMP-binding protein